MQFNNLADGNYYLNATATDSLGYSNSTETRLITIDTGAPQFINITGISINSTSTLSHNIIATDSRSVSCFTVSDAVNFSINCTGYLTNATALTAGFTYPLNVTVNDSLNNQRIALIYILVLNSSQTYATNGTMTATQNTTEIIMDKNSLNLSKIIIPSTIGASSSVFLNLASLLNNANATIGSTSIILERVTSTLNYSTEIPAGTSIISKTDWNGRIELPRVNSSTFTAPSGTISITIDLGSSEELNFSKAVKVTLGGNAGKHAGWSRGNSAITDIETECNNVTSPTNIDTVSTRECYIDSGSDLLIWTYHFTSFAAYTPETTPPSATTSSGGGGGGSIKPKNETVTKNETESIIPEIVEKQKQNEELPNETQIEINNENSPLELKDGKVRLLYIIIIILIGIIFFIVIYKLKTIPKKKS